MKSRGYLSARNIKFVLYNMKTAFCAISPSFFVTTLPHDLLMKMKMLHNLHTIYLMNRYRKAHAEGLFDESPEVFFPVTADPIKRGNVLLCFALLN